MDYTPKPIKIDGIQFRSKLEGRWYLFMKRLGWHIEYEPDIKGLNNWIPDFLIIGKKHKILVDVKPIDRAKEWNTHPDHGKILNSGIKNLPDYELLILGTNLQLDGQESMGIFYIRDTKLVQKENKEKVICPSSIHCHENCKKYPGGHYNSETCKMEDGEGNELIELPNNTLYEDGNCIFSCVGDQIGFMTNMMNWCCRITGEGGKTYIFRDNNKNEFRKIDTYWNEAGTQLQWNTPTSEHYLKGKTHPNNNQYCMDCKTNSVNWWKKKNLFYCTECKEVKCFYCWEDEPYDSPKHYAVHKAWTKGGDAVEFFYATVNSESWGE
tara:strand:+ start:743 stop:1714 length:972 start_codon:yes stop_codon:yes gene_type:complete